MSKVSSLEDELRREKQTVRELQMLIGALLKASNKAPAGAWQSSVSECHYEAVGQINAARARVAALHTRIAVAKASPKPREPSATPVGCPLPAPGSAAWRTLLMFYMATRPLRSADVVEVGHFETLSNANSTLWRLRQSGHILGSAVEGHKISAPTAARVARFLTARGL